MPLCSHTITVPVWATLSRNQNCRRVGKLTRAFAKTRPSTIRNDAVDDSSELSLLLLGNMGVEFVLYDGMALAEEGPLGTERRAGCDRVDIGACVSLGISSPILSDTPEEGELRRRPCRLRERQFTCCK